MVYGIIINSIMILYSKPLIKFEVIPSSNFWMNPSTIQKLAIQYPLDNKINHKIPIASVI